MPKMISMKRPKDEVREKMAPAPAEAMAPDYPWGLVLHLEAPELDRLGMEKLPKVGSEITITAKVKVTRVSQSASEREGGMKDESRCVDMQITDLALGAGD